MFFVHCAVPEIIHNHSKEGFWKFHGEGFSKAKIFKAKYEPEL